MTDFLASLSESGLSLRVRERPARPRTAGERVLYVNVRMPNPSVLHEAHALVDRLAAELGIPVPILEWFAPADEAPHDATIYGALARAGLMFECDYGDIEDVASRDDSVLGGWADTDPGRGLGPTILVLHTLRGDLLRMVIAHEMRHLAQDASMTREEREAEAERFGMVYVAA